MNSVTRADGVNIEMAVQSGARTRPSRAVETREKIDALRADLPTDLTRYQSSRLRLPIGLAEPAHLRPITI
jgi:hypothetical protein